MKRAALLVLVGLVVSLLLAASPVPLRGTAQVIDGDTLDLAGVRVRLSGIDAPELRQTCTRAGQQRPCGREARDALSALLAGARVSCAGQARDRYGRLLARCDVAGADVGAVMVQDGMAIASRRHSMDYVALEQAAERAGRGIWQGEMQDPAAFRAGTAMQGDCAIKGNISAGGRIYHMPGQRDYAATEIADGPGERWFCSEAEAGAAGWRKAKG